MSQVKIFSVREKKSILFVIIFSFVLSGCSAFSKTLDRVGYRSVNNLTNITIESTLDSHSNLPVAVDLVFISDEPLADLLSHLSGPQWFSNKEVLIKQNRRKLKVVSHEVAPLSLIRSIELPKQSKRAVGVLLFANYRTKQGQKVARLEEYKEVNIKLEQRQYLIKSRP